MKLKCFHRQISDWIAWTTILVVSLVLGLSALYAYQEARNSFERLQLVNERSQTRCKAVNSLLREKIGECEDRCLISSPDTQ